MASTDEARVPEAVAALVHQSDASGRQQRVAAPQSPSFKRTPMPARAKASARQKKRGFWSSLLCCVSKDPSEQYAVPHPRPKPPKRSVKYLLPEQAPDLKGKKSLILDLDETLVHSSFKPVPTADYIIPVNIEGTIHHVYVIKRPCVDEFLRRMSRHFEIVVYTASLAKYADPLLDQLDIHGVINARLFREHCTQYQGNFVKDLTRLGRRLESTIIVDNSPASYMFQPQHAIGCTSFIDNMHDRELLYIADFLETLVDVEDVSKFTHLWNAPHAMADEVPQ